MNTDKIYAESIAKEYAPKKNSKIIALRKLDSKAKLPATVFTYTWGTIFTLIFGTGMCLGMKVIGDGIISMVIGIIIGIIGIAGVCLAYPLYNRITKTQREKVAPEIIALSDELLK